MLIEFELDADYVSYGQGTSAFDVPNWAIGKIERLPNISGKVSVDDNEVKFSFNPYFHDGDLVSDNPKLRIMAKQVIIGYLLTLI